MKRSLFLQFFLWLCLPFSRIINRINWRFGRPYSCKNLNIEDIKNWLEPGMVILTHKKFECSSLFIPGYWTHTAMVVRQGQIIDATRKGVCISSFETFFSSVDDFVVLKPVFCGRKTIRKACKMASLLVGLPFSFDFRNTGSVFYCSGLVCWVYSRLFVKEKKKAIPLFFKNFIDDNIIRPMDFYKNREVWQIIS